MATSDKFLTPEDEQDIVDAIRVAEQNTSGEIRVHIEQTAKKDVFERAMEVFYALKMDNTKANNGVLIYVATQDRTFVIYGDKGINDVVESDFWESTKNSIAAQFKKGAFKQGLVEGILKAGNALKKHFPWTPDDKNELPNTISKG